MDRPKKRGSDEHILGVFAEGERPRRKPRPEKSAPDLTKGVSFVRGQTLQPTSVPEPKETKDDDSDVDSRFVLDASLPTAQGFQPTVEGPKLPARNKLSFGQMSNNYGKGFAMLQKMGFTGGGLGKHNDGIANPIEVQKRQGKQGLQDDGEMVDQDLYGNENGRKSIEELLSIGKPGKPKEKPQISEGWKRERGERDAKKKPKTVYKTAEENAASVPAMRIVDMRGPEVRVASSFAELAASLSGDSVRSLKELRHNTRLLVARYEEKVRIAAERKRHCENVILSAAKEQERLRAVDHISESDVKSCKDLVLEIESLRERQDEGSISLSELADSFRRLEQTRPKEFHVLQAVDVAFALALPCARRELSTWHPFKNDLGFRAVAKWKQLGRASHFESLLDASLVPLLRKALVAWSPRDFEPCVRMMETCQEVLGSVEELVAQVVLPRLRAEVEAWDPRLDPKSAHLWLHPWLPLLGRKMEMLWAPVRFKISSCLEKWDVEDASAHGLLEPWSQVFDTANWEPLMEKVLGKLEKALRNMQIKPDGQDLKPMKCLFAWMDLIPLESLARVLEQGFFPQWHQALKQWLRSKACNFQEVLQWYQGWRALFPAELRDQLVVQRHLAQGLEVMKHLMAGGELQEEPERLPPAPSARSLVAEEVSLSLSDYVTQVAAEEGLIFLPKKQRRNGKQVYQFGSATVQLERNLIFVAPKGEGEWKAASVDELLKLAKAKK